MLKRPPKCPNCDGKMILIDGTKYSYECESCGARNISSLDKEYMKKYIAQRERMLSES